MDYMVRFTVYLNILGLEINYEKAYKLFFKAAELGDSTS